MEKQMLIDQTEGLKVSIKTLRETEKKHIEADTLTKQTEKARVEKGELETKMEDLKKRKIELKFQKASSLNHVAQKIEAEITKLLPNGQAVFTIGEDGVFIGLKHHGNRTTPYLSLSGGEKAFYDAALANALLGKSQNKILIGEAAEIDEEKLGSLLKEIVRINPDVQIILNSCHEPKEVPKEWNLIRL